jgi:subtilisin family serine protease
MEALEERVYLSLSPHGMEVAQGVPLNESAALEGSRHSPAESSFEPTPTGTLDNSFATARDLGSLVSESSINDSVGWRDYADFLRFEITEPGTMHLQISAPSASLFLRVYDSLRRPIESAYAGSGTTLGLEMQLTPGNYYVRVYVAWYYDVTDYRLELDFSQGPARTDPSTPPPAIEPPSPTTNQPSNDNGGGDPFVSFPAVPYYGGVNDWGLNGVQAPEVWAQGYTGSSVVVAVIDTGIDLDHVDLDSNIWVNAGEIAGNHRDDDGNGFVDDVYGWDFANDDNNPTDIAGHGTHVAGIVAAERNGTGATGVAYGAQVMAVQVLDSRGSGTILDVAAGIRYAVDNGADIINLSLGAPFGSTVLLSALRYALLHDVLVVAASGNDGAASPSFPAAYSAVLSNVISVGAHTAQDRLAAFSNREGNGVQVDAPGVSIYSTIPGNRYANWSGTSMAAPYVSGVAALAWAANPSLGASQLRDLITEGAVRGVAGSDSKGGVDAARTVARAT